MGERHVSANEHTKLSGAEETGGRGGGQGGWEPGFPTRAVTGPNVSSHRTDVTSGPPSSRPSREAGNLGPYVTHPDFQTWAANSSFLRPWAAPVNHVRSVGGQAAGFQPLMYRVGEHTCSAPSGEFGGRGAFHRQHVFGDPRHHL